MPLSHLKSEEEVDSFLKDCKQLTLLYLFAPWAAECQQITEVFQTLAEDCENRSVNAEEVQDFCKKNEVSSVPVVLFFKDGESVARVQGAKAADLTKTVASLRDKHDDQESLNARLKALINKAPIMLFMKGTPEEARCGFSRRMLEILHKHNVKFDSFNVLSDETVREGLKIYSDWPTYPQLYANGELIGGVDIVTQLAESNELLSALGLQ
ncbi:Glutaredoxin 3 [Echinococcus granulosus]|uniref:Glutaredoxin 3 n=1 Tax=Echinococcus granulosus TaxID=6210 RepID=U6JEN8_ECHGR|nr:Glutaredoxin 3 [Echinococcus granulosus]EUB60970.1 Glutaredoxin 3 [Echinococcus granulosus]KAH9284916.1 Glutaredoxin 3 [Echinococcus granulosus]CDS21816.1 glutaredoxin 3 [Echinococcus granulosus]